MCSPLISVPKMANVSEEKGYAILVPAIDGVLIFDGYPPGPAMIPMLPLHASSTAPFQAVVQSQIRETDLTDTTTYLKLAYQMGKMRR